MSSARQKALLWAPSAWVGGRWHDAVVLRVGVDGCWSGIETGVPAPPGATRLPGPAVPGMVDAHSHAFQRAFAGLAERRAGAHDDFWSWRDRMYGVAARITDEQLRAVAAQLFAELLEGGYTHVCEFHYLHHGPDGRGRGDPLAMARAVADAAVDAGIGLTLLPVLYERAGFDAAGLRPDQRRFASSVDDVIGWRDAIRAWRLPRVDAGLAVHSLRAVSVPSLRRLVQLSAGDPAPIHVHVAEQTGEVEACRAATGRRPVEWLCRELPLDARWQLVHATHVTPDEIAAVADCGAGVVLCPTTEADLGDGLTDLDGWIDAGVPLSLGSDSQVCRSWVPELRWLEWGQRLAQRRRNVAARPQRGEDSTAALLLARALPGGAAAAGRGAGAATGFTPGAPADLLVLDPDAPGVAGVPCDDRLDALVFATDAPPWSQVWVRGQCRVEAGRHPSRARLCAGFVAAMTALWSGQEGGANPG